MSYNHITQHSSHLWISDPQTVEQTIIADLQQSLCLNKHCLTCSACIQVANKTHPWVTWLEPENTYTLDQIDHIISSVQFKLDQSEKRFFIFTHSEELTPACCNRLLKTVEEPNQGYHFIFMTNRPDEILPTLRSRCIIKSFATQAVQHQYQEILQPFQDFNCNNPLQFMKTIDKLQIKESTTKEIIDLLIEYFYLKLKTSIQQNSDKNESLKYLDSIIICKNSLKQLPLPGSNKLFWKNMYLTFHHHAKCLKK